jgi:hypothetical protein
MLLRLVLEVGEDDAMNNCFDLLSFQYVTVSRIAPGDDPVAFDGCAYEFQLN